MGEGDESIHFDETGEIDTMWSSAIEVTPLCGRYLDATTEGIAREEGAEEVKCLPNSEV